jgi:hypothetical protein
MFGFVKFSFKGGFSEDFLTHCFADGIAIRDVAKSADGFTAYCRIGTYKKLHRYALCHGGKVRVVKKCGLPFLLHPLKNRVGFFVGMLAFVIIISFLSCFVWNVEIVGNSRVSDTVLSTYLDNHNLRTGVMWSSFDRQSLCWDIMSDFEDISWVHINKIGTTARVEINETTVAPIGDEDKLKGINVYRKELQAVAYREQKDITVKSTKTYSTFHFFTADIPLYIKKETGDISQQKESYLNFKDVNLPIGVTTYQEQFLSSQPKVLTDDELLELAGKKLQFLQEKEFDGFEIINQSESYEIDDDKCVITCSYILKRK